MQHIVLLDNDAKMHAITLEYVKNHGLEWCLNPKPMGLKFTALPSQQMNIYMLNLH